MLQGKNVLTVMVEGETGKKFFRVKKSVIARWGFLAFGLVVLVMGFLGVGLGLTIKHWALADLGLRSLPKFSLKDLGIPKPSLPSLPSSENNAQNAKSVQEPVPCVPATQETSSGEEPEAPPVMTEDLTPVTQWGTQAATLDGNAVGLGDFKINRVGEEIVVTGIFANRLGKQLSGRLMGMLIPIDGKSAYFHTKVFDGNSVLPSIGLGETFSFIRARLLNMRLPAENGFIKVLLFDHEGRFLRGWSKGYNKSK